MPAFEPPDISLVSYHAVTRYVQRVLGVEVKCQAGLSSRANAKAHAAAAATTVDEIRKTIMTPALFAVRGMGFTRVFCPQFVAVLDRNGVVRTVLRRQPAEIRRLRLISKSEERSDRGHRARRRRPE